MKNFIVCSLLCFMTLSCADDSIVEAYNNKSHHLKSAQVIAPENSSNQWDYIGKKYYEALKVYTNTNGFSNSSSEMSEKLIFLRQYVKKENNTGKGLIPFTDEMVNAIMDDPENSLIAIISDSGLGSDAKSSLISFLQSLLSQRHESFNFLYAFIVSYEEIILDNTTLINDEKDTILIVASISRYSLYSEAERKDRDWETSVGSKPSSLFFKANEAAMICIIAVLSDLI